MRWYTNREIEYIRRWYGIKTVEEISKHLGRPYGSVLKRAQREGLRSGLDKPLGQDAEEIKDMIKTGANIYEIAATIPGSSPESIRKRVKNGLLYSPQEYKTLCDNNRRAWARRRSAK